MRSENEQLQARRISLDEDDSYRLRQLLAESEAIQEMATRVRGDNEEDFDMLQNANRVTFRLLDEARKLLEPQA